MGKIKFIINRLREKLWVKPLVVCVFSVAAVFAAKATNYNSLFDKVPFIQQDSLEALLSILSASMLVTATFAVSSMVSAYASAGSTATPRTFSLIIADDRSQNALSVFIGAFIYSIIALIAVKNEYYSDAGIFILFVLTLFAFAVIIVTFVRWVDSIARLGRLGNIIDKVEKATADSLKQRISSPTLLGIPLREEFNNPQKVVSNKIGYIQRIDVSKLQKIAEKYKLHIQVRALPGKFAVPDFPIAFYTREDDDGTNNIGEIIEKAFLIGEDRKFDDDPRFGLVVLGEIAGRALSPAVNDPGTAIDIIGTLVRLFSLWSEKPVHSSGAEVCDRIEVPELKVSDLMDDAFGAIERDGAGTLEVVIRLQKGFLTLSTLKDMNMKEAAKMHSLKSYEKTKRKNLLQEEIELISHLVTRVQNEVY